MLFHVDVPSKAILQNQSLRLALILLETLEKRVLVRVIRKEVEHTKGVVEQGLLRELERRLDVLEQLLHQLRVTVLPGTVLQVKVQNSLCNAFFVQI